MGPAILGFFDLSMKLYYNDYEMFDLYFTYMLFFFYSQLGVAIMGVIIEL